MKMNKRKRKKAATFIIASLVHHDPPYVEDVDLMVEFDLIAKGLAKRYGVQVHELPARTSNIVKLVDKENRL